MADQVADEDTQKAPSRFAQRFARLRARYRWLDHLVRAGARYTDQHGDYFAAAITYFSILALVPLLMVAFAVASFVLRSHPDLLHQLQDKITAAAPEGLGDTLNKVVDQAISSATAVGVIGLLAAAYSGLGWMTNLREALTAQWGQDVDKPPFVRALLGDALALIGLGLAIAVSYGLTTLASGLASVVLGFLGIDDAAWARALLGLLGALLAILANWLVLTWVIARLPRQPVTWRSAARAGLVAAVSIEALKQGFTFFLAGVTNSPTGALFGPVLGLLIFIYIVSRLVIFLTAWAATARENERPQPVAAPPPAVIRPVITVNGGPDGRTAAGLVGAGAAAGFIGSRLLARRRG